MFNNTSVDFAGLIAQIVQTHFWQCNDYRGVLLTTCIGEVLSSVLSAKIKHYLDLTNGIGLEHAGFRKRYSQFLAGSWTIQDHTGSWTKLLSPCGICSMLFVVCTQQQPRLSRWATVTLVFFAHEFGVRQAGNLSAYCSI